MTLDTEKLTLAIKLCFANARDIENFDAEQRMEMLFRGKILRGHLVNLISVHIGEAGTAKITEANQKIAEINRRLKSTRETLQNYADTVERLANLAGNLEGLIQIAAQFA